MMLYTPIFLIPFYTFFFSFFLFCITMCCYEWQKKECAGGGPHCDCVDSFSCAIVRRPMVKTCKYHWRRSSFHGQKKVCCCESEEYTIRHNRTEIHNVHRICVCFLYGWIGHSQPATANIHGGFFLVCPFVWSFYYRGLFQSITPPAVIDLLRFCFTNSHCVSYRKRFFCCCLTTVFY